MLAVLAAMVLMGLAVPSADAGVPRARPYHRGGSITLDTNLLSVSGASAWAIDEYLQQRTTLPRLGAAFLAAERKYGVNARFLLAAAMHESAWGRGSIARVKHNLFGYNAYDRDPFHYASAYATYAANIKATARFIRSFYLTPGGRWWGGQPTLRSMQQFWSSSHRWGENVSRIATSIHLDTLARRSIVVAAPIVSGLLHGGERASVRLAWTGGAVPKGVTFVATWEPVASPSDVPVVLVPAGGTGDLGPLGAAALATASPTPSPAARTTGPSGHGPSKTVAARRSRTRARSMTLSVPAPRRPGSYRLRLELRDTDRQPLRPVDRVRIPSIDVRVWNDRAVSIELEPGPDGTGAVMRITNTGRETIPAVASRPAAVRGVRDAYQVRSLVSVTATAGAADDPAPVTLLATPLVADLRPGASIALDLPAIDGATGRMTNRLSVRFTVLGDSTWLSPSAATGVWLADSVLGRIDRVWAGTQTSSPADDGVEPGGSTTAAPPSPIPSPTPNPTPSPSPTPSPGPTATPSPTASTTPVRKRHKTRYAEHSSAIAYRGSWGNAAYGGYIGGNVAWSRTPGSSATFTFRGSSVSWIGPQGPTRGLALVLVDGRAVARIGLWRSSFVARAVLFTHTFRTAGSHTLTIKVLTDPYHPYVAIDELRVKP